MKRPAPVLGVLILLGAVSTAVLAQPRPRPPRRITPAADAATPADAAADASAPDPDASAAAPASDAGAVSHAQVDPDAGTLSLNDASIPLRQVGQGTVLHYPIPEQMARTAVPVFAQVRSSAPIDHVSLFYRGVGASRYTELRMTAMGQQFHLPSGFGATIPCDDIFPPRVEYYVQAIDSSGAPNGSAGSADSPVQVAIVERRSYPAPTLPGQAPPRNCGSMAQSPTARDAGAAGGQPTRGTADLGEPCRSNNDCRNGLRCGSTHTCVFETNR
ncbi:MAG: hypothetical protein R3A52_01980 [Polyangiales bacterium]